jgi:hypothetical protein
MQRERIDLVARAWIDFRDERIMAGDEAIRMAGEALNNLPALRHVADIVDDRKRAALVQIGVVMRGVRGQHDRTACGIDPHHLQPIGMAADAMHGHAGRDLAIAGMKGDALAIDMTNHQRDVLDGERVPQQAGAHAAARGIGHLAILQMKPRLGKTVEIAGMVVVQMGDDDILDVGGLDTEAFQRIDRIERKLAGPRLCFFSVEAGVDQDVAAVTSNQPNEVVEIRRRGLVRIGLQEIHLGCAGRHGRIAERIDFVGVSHWVTLLFAIGGSSPASHCRGQRSNRLAAERELSHAASTGQCEDRHINASGPATDLIQRRVASPAIHAGLLVHACLSDRGNSYCDQSSRLA